MKVKVEKTMLLNALGKAMRFVPAKSPTPILGGVKIEVVDKRLLVFATDLETGIVVPVSGAEIKEEGGIVLPARQLHSFVQKLDKEIQLKVEGTVCTFTSGKSKTKMNGFPADEYPVFQMPKDESEVQQFVLPADVLHTIADKVVYAASSKEENGARSFLTGANISLNGKLEVVATDTHRVVVLQKAMDGLPEKEITILAKTVRELPNIFPDGSVKVLISGNLFFMVAATGMLHTRLLECKYPDFRRIVPESFAFSATVDAKVLAAAIERSQVLGNECSLFEFGKNSIKIKMTSDRGEFEETIEAAVELEDKFHITLNNDYLLQLLKTINDKAVLSFTTDTSPVIIKPCDDPELTAIILPVNPS